MKHSTAQHTARSVYASYRRARRPLAVLPQLLTAGGYPVRCVRVCARVHNMCVCVASRAARDGWICHHSDRGAEGGGRC
jgi:hypothetical protein